MPCCRTQRSYSTVLGRGVFAEMEPPHPAAALALASTPAPSPWLVTGRTGVSPIGAMAFGLKSPFGLKALAFFLQRRGLISKKSPTKCGSGY
jgi:hypothetical protein